MINAKDNFEDFLNLFWLLYENIFLSIISDINANVFSIANVLSCEIHYQKNKKQIYKYLEEFKLNEFKELLEEIDKKIIHVQKQTEKVDEKLKSEFENYDERLLFTSIFYDESLRSINEKYNSKFYRFLEGDKLFSKLFEIAKILSEIDEKITFVKDFTFRQKDKFKKEDCFLEVYDKVIDFEYDFEGALVKNMLKGVYDEHIRVL